MPAKPKTLPKNPKTPKSSTSARKPRKPAVKKAAAVVEVPRYAPVVEVAGGPSAPVALRPAGGWLRLLARFVDGAVLGVVGVVFGLIFGLFLGDVWVFMLGTLLGLAYQGYFISQYKATPGRMFLKLQVVRAQNEEALSFWRAVGRAVADWLNMLTLYLGYLMVFWRRDKRGLHDLIADARVVRRAEPLPAWRWVLATLLPLFSVLLMVVAFVLGVAAAIIHARGAEPEAMSAEVSSTLESSAPAEGVEESSAE